jgi:hypothetical protein
MDLDLTAVAGARAIVLVEASPEPLMLAHAAGSVPVKRTLRVHPGVG